MKTIFIGSGDFGIPALRKLCHEKARHDVVGVVTQPDRPAGRGRTVTPTPVKQFALENNLRVISPENINAPEVVAEIRSWGADLAVVAAFGQFLGNDILVGMFPVGIVNIHASKLPRWRGAAPFQWAILSGDIETGVTVFRIVKKMDAGPVLAIRSTSVDPAETADELHDRLAAIGCDALDGAIARLIADPADPGDPQDESLATPAPKLSKADSLIDFGMSAIEVERKINGLYSWPAARVRFVSQSGRDEEVILARALADPGDQSITDSEQIGTVTERGGVRCAIGEIAIMDIRPVGGALMGWDAFVNGRHVSPGDRFVKIEK